MRILIVEDNDELASLLARGLRNEQYAVDTASGVHTASELLATNRYDVVTLDLGLPDGDGLELCRRLHDDAALRPSRVIVVSARDGVNDRVAGLDAGADDYLVKPFDLTELLARLRALHRRGDVVESTVTIGDLTIDLARHRVVRGGLDVALTGREYALLRYLAHHLGRPIPAEELVEHVWDRNADPFSNSVRVIMSRLRRKLGEPDLIRTVTGVGYVLEATR